MRGKLYGIGAGPGDPDLLTVKAIKTIQKCNTIAVPKTGDNGKVALKIIEGYLDGKDILECQFSMDKDISVRKESRRLAAKEIIKSLDDGKDVGFITLGDPATYSTYMYVHEIIVNEGFDAQIIPGITSYSAAAAALGIALCESDEILTVIPMSHGEDIDKLLNLPGNKVIMKSGSNLPRVLKKLKEQGYDESVKIVARATMDGQRSYTSISEYEKSPETSYFTLAIVK